MSNKEFLYHQYNLALNGFTEIDKMPIYTDEMLSDPEKVKSLQRRYLEALKIAHEFLTQDDEDPFDVEDGDYDDDDDDSWN